MECTIETKTMTILQFVRGLRGSLHLTFEEGTWATWLYNLLKPRVTEIVVSNPRRNALLKEGGKSDRIDARKLAELLRANLLKLVYHGEHAVRTLKELARSYVTISQDLSRVMTRLKAVYRSWAILCAGKQVFPACPDLEDQAPLWKLLKPEDIGVQLTEGFMMDPEASVSALAFHHPDCVYFSVGESSET
jgi:Vitamin B12 dependent methionine synthase, activation domain/Transposase